MGFYYKFFCNYCGKMLRQRSDVTSLFKFCLKNKSCSQQLGHHASCLMNTRCPFCTMDRNLCRRTGVCKPAMTKPNPRQTEADNRAIYLIYENLLSSLRKFFKEVDALKVQMPESDNQESLMKRVTNCKSQYDSISSVQNPSASTIQSAETCLCRLQRVYYDMKSVVQKQPSAKN